MLHFLTIFNCKLQVLINIQISFNLNYQTPTTIEAKPLFIIHCDFVPHKCTKQLQHKIDTSLKPDDLYLEPDFMAGIRSFW